MIPNAIAMRGDYAGLQMPVVIIAGDDDRLIDIDDRVGASARSIAQSTVRRVRGAGHMVHQTAPAAILAGHRGDGCGGREAETMPRAE
jgi:pimeloyl-ACP methyl ester carboxylesterase